MSRVLNMDKQLLRLAFTILVLLAVELTTTIGNSQEISLGSSYIIAIHYGDKLVVPDIAILVENTTECSRVMINITLLGREGEQRVEDIDTYCLVARSYTIYIASIDTQKIALEPSRSYVLFIDIAVYARDKIETVEELGPVTLYVYSLDNLVASIDRKLEQLTKDLQEIHKNTTMLRESIKALNNSLQTIAQEIQLVKLNNTTNIANKVQKIGELVKDYDTRLQDIIGRIKSLSKALEELQTSKKIYELERQINLQYKLVLTVIALQVLVITLVILLSRRRIIIEEIEA